MDTIRHQCCLLLFSAEKYVLSTKEEFIAPDQIAGLTYVLNLTAQVVTIVLCLLLFLII